MSQTTVVDFPPIGVEGGFVNSSFYRDTLSKLSNDSSPIPFGHLVVLNSADDDDQCRLPADTLEISSGDAWGVALFQSAKEANPGNTVDTAGANTYSINEAVPCVRKGRVWVITEDEVAIADLSAPVFVRFAADTFAVLGAFRTDADTASAVALPGAKFMTTGAAGELVQLELNLGL